MNTAEDLSMEEDEFNVHRAMERAGFGDFTGTPLVIFGLPGAFTPTCSKSQLPGYEKAYNEFNELGFGVLCISVNDSYVMQAWKEAMGVVQVGMAADGNGTFTEDMNMLVDKSNMGMGRRSWRYAAVVDSEGTLLKMFIEEGKGDNVEDDPYEASKPEKVLEWLKEQ